MFRQLGNLFGIAKSTSWQTARRVAEWLITLGIEFVKLPEGAVLESAKENSNPNITFQML